MSPWWRRQKRQALAHPKCANVVAFCAISPNRRPSGSFADQFFGNGAAGRRDASLLGGAEDVDDRPEIVFDDAPALLTELSDEDLLWFRGDYERAHDALKVWLLWVAADFAMEFCSDDGFHYFRSWLISRGRAAYERVHANPDELSGLLPSPKRGVKHILWFEQDSPQPPSFREGSRRLPFSPDVAFS